MFLNFQNTEINLAFENSKSYKFNAHPQFDYTLFQ